MKLHYIFFLFSLYFVSCCTSLSNTKNINPPHFENYEGKLNVRWQKPLKKDTSLTYSIDLELFDGNILMSQRDFVNVEKIIEISGTTGEKIWEWEDPDCNEIISDVGQVMSKNNFIVSNGNQIFNLDLYSGKLNWKSEKISCRPRINELDGYIYLSIHDAGMQYDTSKLIRTPIDDLAWEEVYSSTRINNFRPGIEPPVLWKNSKNESVLIFQNRSYNFHIGQGKIDLIAYNIDEKKEAWRKIDIAKTGNSSIFLPIIYEDKVYFQSSNTIHCFNAEDGQLIWEKTFEQNGLYTCNSIVADGKVFVNLDNEDIVALDAKTGETVWSNPDSQSFNSGNMIYFDNFLYFISEGNSDLYAINAEDGEIKWKEKSPNEPMDNQSGFRSGLTIDKEKRLLYAIDGLFILCIQL